MDDTQFQEIISKIADDPIKIAAVKDAMEKEAVPAALLAAGKGIMGAGKWLGGQGTAAGKWLGGQASKAIPAAGRGLERLGKGTVRTLGRTGGAEQAMNPLTARAIGAGTAAAGVGGTGLAANAMFGGGQQPPMTRTASLQTAGRGILSAGKWLGGGLERLGKGTVRTVGRTGGAEKAMNPLTAKAIGAGTAATGIGGAGLANAMFGGEQQPQMMRTAGVQAKISPAAIQQHIIQGAGLAAVIGSGALFANAVQNSIFGNEDMRKEVNRESGRMSAKQMFKHQMLVALEPRHKKIFGQLTKDDEIISKASKKQMKSTFETMKHFAPNLAADENAARSFLREYATYEAGPSYATLKSLADSEKAIVEAGGTV